MARFQISRILDFGPIRLGLRAGFIVFPGLLLALLFYARALVGRTDGA